MRLYSEQDLEILRTRKLLRDWTADGLLSEAQHNQLQQEVAPSDLRTTNIFLRAVLFLFTLVALAGITALFFMVFVSASGRALAIPTFFIAVACYVAAEVTVAQARLYRFGVEEALTVAAIAALFVALQFAAGDVQATSNPLVLVICALSALWTWLRFGYAYTFAVAMLFAAFVPGCFTHSVAAQHALIAILYAVGLAVLAPFTARHRFDALRSVFSTAELLLWTGIYLSLNLLLTASGAVLPLRLLQGLSGGADVSRPFYWLTWVLIWCLPATVLVLAIRRKDRPLLILGAALALLTLLTNKPYLGMARHPWDPMILGIVLMGLAWFLHRWLAGGSGGLRHGFTAARLYGAHNSWMSTAPAALGLFVPHAPGATTGPTPSHPSPSAPLGQGGASGGAGAGGSF